MRAVGLIGVAICILSWGGSARSMDGSAYVSCEGGEHVLTLEGLYRFELDGECVGLVFKRESVGVCEPTDFIPEVPLPFDIPPTPGVSYVEYSATMTVVPRTEGVTYRYSPYGIRPDGSRERIFRYCDNDFRGYALATCENVPFVRGVLEFGGDCFSPPCFTVSPCESDCWSENLGVGLGLESLIELLGEEALDYVGQVVDVYGGRTYCGMVGDDYHYITRVESAPSGQCGPVPTAELSWGNLKVMYR